MQKLNRLLIVLTLAVFYLAPVHADGGNAGRGSPLAPFQKLIDGGEYQQAITELDKECFSAVKSSMIWKRRSRTIANKIRPEV